MKCPNCNATDHEEGAKFCHVCGAKLQADFIEASKCPTCGVSQPAGARFCNKCGAPMSRNKCPICDETIPSGARFCNYCGALVSGNEASIQSNSQSGFSALNQLSAVDLGLPSATIWASCNVGAVKEEEYGGYYMLYEIEDIEKNGGWKLPSSDQITELIKCCSFLWTRYNGCYGAKLVGPNGKILFLPAAGCRYEYGYEGVGSYGCYWREDKNRRNNPLSGGFGFDQQFQLYLCTGHFSVGYSVRLVMK